MKKRIVMVVAAAGFFLASIAAARGQEGGPLYIQVGRLFTGSTIIENGIIVVEGERITAAGTGIMIPDGARVVDYGDATAVPGLIDGHVHFLGTTLDYVRDMTRRGFARLVEQSISGCPDNRRTYLLRGVTAVLDMGDIQSSIDAVRADAKAGRLVSPDIFTGGPMFTAPGGAPTHPRASGCTTGPTPWPRRRRPGTARGQAARA